MKHIWVIECFGGRKWSVSLQIPCAFLKKDAASARRATLSAESPGLKWRVAKYERVK